MASQGTLLLFHCASNTGYAIGSLERAFDRAARLEVPNGSSVHYAYSSLDRGRPEHLDGVDSDVVAIGYSQDRSSYSWFVRWLKERSIVRVLAFDLPVSAPILRPLRASGVSRVVSYWGASISGIYPWYLRPFRRAQFACSLWRPDHFVFESRDMQARGVKGAGIPANRTSVVRIGVSCERFYPAKGDCYAHVQLGIPRDRRIVFFSGHMEERKGVHVLIDAFAQLPPEVREKLHLVLAGNTKDDAARLSARVSGHPASAHVTFAGYRTDIPNLLRSVSLGVIASTGWDSFTVSAVEMAASGLPLIVSDLPGLREAVVPGVTGELFPAGSSSALSAAISSTMCDEERRSAYGAAARARALTEFSEETQVRALRSCLYNE